MPDSHPANGEAQAQTSSQAHQPFPAVRLLYAIGFAILAWFVFWITLILALVQFIHFAVAGRVNEELRSFCINMVQYLWELLAFITFVRDDQPFPIGPFPRHPAT